LAAQLAFSAAEDHDFQNEFISFGVSRPDQPGKRSATAARAGGPSGMSTSEFRAYIISKGYVIDSESHSHPRAKNPDEQFGLSANQDGIVSVGGRVQRLISGDLVSARNRIVDPDVNKFWDRNTVKDPLRNYVSSTVNERGDLTLWDAWAGLPRNVLRPGTHWEGQWGAGALPVPEGVLQSLYDDDPRRNREAIDEYKAGPNQNPTNYSLGQANFYEHIYQFRGVITHR
jgi:hypothetical protein